MICVSSQHVRLHDVLDIVETALASLTRRIPASVSREDLASVGKLALIGVLARRDEITGDFRAYCYVRVRGAMLDELRRLDPLNRRQRERLRAIADTRQQLARELGRAPTLTEIALRVSLSSVVVDATLTAAANAAVADETDWASIPDDASPSPIALAEDADLRGALACALDRLPRNQALALRRYYFEDATLDDIADELGVSRERARQVREAGEKKLRADYLVLTLWQTYLHRDQG